MEINDQDFLDFGDKNAFPLGGQISPSTVASAQVDKAELAMANDLSPTRIAETTASSAKISPSSTGNEISSVTNKPLIDFRKYDFIEYDEIEEAGAEPPPIKIEVNPLTPTLTTAAAAELPKQQTEQIDSGYKIDGSKSQNEDGTFKISLTLKDLISNTVVSDSLVVNEKSIDVAYTKAVEELTKPLAVRADSDMQADAIIRSMNSGKIEIPSIDDLRISPTSRAFVEAGPAPTEITPAVTAKAESAVGEKSQLTRSEVPSRIEIMKAPAQGLALEPTTTPALSLALEPTKTPALTAPTLTAITQTAIAESPVAESTGFTLSSLVGSDLLKEFEEIEEVATTESKPKFSDTEILSAIFGSTESEQSKPSQAAEVRVESGKPMPNKSVINEIVNPPNPVVPALEGLGQTITNTSSSMTDTLAGKMETAFSAPTKGEATQMLANNVTNITNAQSQTASETAAQAAKPVEQASPSEQVGGGMSEYYLRAIYEALVVQGVKLRTI